MTNKYDQFDDLKIELIQIGNEFVLSVAGRDVDGKTIPYPDDRVNRLTPKEHIESRAPNVGDVLTHPIYRVLSKMKRKCDELMGFMVERDLIHATFVDDIEQELNDK